MITIFDLHNHSYNLSTIYRAIFSCSIPIRICSLEIVIANGRKRHLSRVTRVTMQSSLRTAEKHDQEVRCMKRRSWRKYPPNTLDPWRLVEPYKVRSVNHPRDVFRSRTGGAWAWKHVWSARELLIYLGVLLSREGELTVPEWSQLVWWSHVGIDDRRSSYKRCEAPCLRSGTKYSA
jgi:hypothetical protein